MEDTTAPVVIHSVEVQVDILCPIVEQEVEVPLVLIVELVGSSFDSFGGFGGRSYSRGYTSYNRTTVYNNGGYHGGGYYSQPSMTSGYSNAYTPTGPMRLVRAIITVLVIVAIAYTLISIKPWQPASTMNREKLTGVAAFDANCVTDELSWFDNVNSAGGKLKNILR